MKSVKAFLLCVAAVLTVLYAVAVTKPAVNVGVDTKSGSPDIKTTENIEAEDVSELYSLTDFSESESTSVDSVDDETLTDEKSSDTVTASTQDRTVTSFTENQTTKHEITIHKTETTKKHETSTQKQPTAHKETTTKRIEATVDVNLNDDEEMTVYYTKSGSRYHYANPCGRGTYYPTTLADAKKRGLTPCQKCVLH